MTNYPSRGELFDVVLVH
ncbi:hypothetical protein JL09_g6399 [Pichia kudriavzevii]|uniref:Uncharacterized protein n=1 Tax=Pichia kudriavzevii TaxID=4909 RepID=A0A099NQX5_PICKU|nr:hypothetical protein JL09_g6399 [Pichia kudriavzevii]